MQITDEYIALQANKSFLKAIKRYSLKNKKELGEVNILLYLKGEEQEGYQVYVNGMFSEEVTIKELLGVKVVDVTGFSYVAPPYILTILKNLSNERASKKVDVSVYVNEEGDDVRYFFYDEGKFVREVDILDLLKIKTPT